MDGVSGRMQSRQRYMDFDFVRSAYHSGHCSDTLRKKTFEQYSAIVDCYYTTKIKGSSSKV